MVLDFLRQYGDKGLVSAPYSEAKARSAYLSALKKANFDSKAPKVVKARLHVITAQKHAAKVQYDNDVKTAEKEQNNAKLASLKQTYDDRLAKINAGQLLPTLADEAQVEKDVFETGERYRNFGITYRPELVDQHILLSVDHLKQFFDMGGGYKTKAVHDVSFQIKEGECFGLVGESGCGKTTTGRSIIRLYNITSGSIYYKGYRISGGTRWYEKEIKWSRIHTKEKIKALKAEEKAKISLLSVSCENVDRVKLEEQYKAKAAALKREKRDELQEKNDPTQDNNDLVLEEIRQTYAKKEAALAEEEKQALAPFGLSEEERKKKIAAIEADYRGQIKAIKAEEAAHVHEQQNAIGSIKYDNRHVNKRLMSEIQMIFQDPVDSLDPRMTVEDIIQEGLHIQHQYDKAANHQKCVDILEKVGLIPEYASRYPHEFSGGQRQRIGIARALIMNPRFLICDEPISALDVSIRAQILNLLNDIKEEMGLTLMFIAHDLSVVKYFCDRIAVMYFGNMVELASSDELFAHPLHPYTKALLSAIPKPDPLSEKNRIRKIYNPATAHDYSQQKPTFREILPGHWILCNDAEELKYREEIKTLDIANAAKDKENDRISAVLDTERQTSSASGSTKKKGK